VTRLSTAIVGALLALVPLAVLVGAPELAHAQAAADAAEGVGFGNSKGVALFFWVCAIASVAGSIFVITRRNLISAVMGMVGTFFAIAALYAMLYAHFLAVIQVLVYAGAIMVLFVFVVMIINRPEDEPWALQGLAGKGLAGVALVYLIYRLAKVLWTVKDQPHAVAEPLSSGGFEFGSTKAVGKVLFTDYLFPFEAISIVLLVAVVGAIAIARPGVTAAKAPTESE
jgi:NADH-quinone oxidoreductase subunit J